MSAGALRGEPMVRRRTETMSSKGFAVAAAELYGKAVDELIGRMDRAEADADCSCSLMGFPVRLMPEKEERRLPSEERVLFHFGKKLDVVRADDFVELKVIF